MPSAIQKFIKDNATPNNVALSAAFNLGDLTSTDHKLRGLFNTLKDIAIWPLQARIAFAGLFSGMQKSIRSLVHDTGSLEAALKKLSKIQELQKVFAPLVGGAQAAKLEVAKLVNFAASKNLKLENVAEAARNLQVMTRGAFSGTKALEDMADAAAGTGNSIDDVASATGDFYSTLREGASIKGAAERLREMGVISQGTADRLNLLQETGANTQRTFDELAESMAKFKGKSGAASSVAGANAAAGQNLKEAFGSPFVASDITNTKNYTEAMKAILPAVSELSEFFSKLIGGMGNFTSETTKWLATSPRLVGFLTTTVELFGGLVAIVSGIAAVGLAGWLVGTAAGMSLFAEATGVAAVALGALGIAIRVAMGAAGIGLLVTVIGTVISVTGAWTSAAEQNQKALEAHRKSSEEFTASLQEQIKAITTLQEKQEALAASRKKIADAEQALKDEPSAPASGFIEKMWSRLGLGSSIGGFNFGPSGAPDPTKTTALAQARAQAAAISAIPNSSLSLGPESVARRAQQARDLEQGYGQLLNEDPTASGARQRELLARQRDAAVEKAKTAEIGVDARNRYEASGKSEITALNLPATSSVNLEARARAPGTTGAEQDALLAQAKNAREQEDAAGALRSHAVDLTNQSFNSDREGRRAKYGANIERQIQQTEMKGRDPSRYENAGAAAEKFESLRGTFGDDEAKRRAVEFQQNAIWLQGGRDRVALNSSVAVSDMARIGGGGGVEQASSISATDIMQQQLKVEEDMCGYLQIIAGKKDGQLSLG